MGWSEHQTGRVGGVDRFCSLTQKRCKKVSEQEANRQGRQEKHKVLPTTHRELSNCGEGLRLALQRKKIWEGE